MRTTLLGAAVALAGCTHVPDPIHGRPLKTEAQAAAEAATLRASGFICEETARPTRRPSIDIATLYDRIDERYPGRRTYFGGDLVVRAPNRRISIELQDAPIASVLRLLADVARTNLVVGDGVSGRVTLRLRNVAWDRALLVLCETRGLHASWEGNILHVRPLKGSG